MPWQRGTSENPIGRVDRVCHKALEDGGYSAEYKTIEDFVEARKGSPQLEKEWQGSREATIVDMSDGPVRCSKGRLQEFRDHLASQRKKTVETFNEESMDIDTPFKAILMKQCPAVVVISSAIGRY